MTPLPEQVGTTAYEVWVRTLRAWAADPTTPLTGLPRLADDTFTPSTFEHLRGHIDKALQAVTSRWIDGLTKAMGKSHDPHLFGTELVQLRAVLSRRVQLSRHPSLPPKLAEFYEQEVQAAIAQYQRDFEEGIRKNSTDRARFDPRHQEAVLRVVRENSFTRVLDYGVAFTGEIAVVEPLPTPESLQLTAERWGARPATKRWSHRVIQPPQDRKD
ncbi:MAG: hypothetical protein V9G15_03440 [Dermatophilaceae bacterium]